LKDDGLLAIDLFSGAGGLSEGLRLAGFKVCLAVESELDPYLVYTANHRDTPVLWKPVENIKHFKPILHRMRFERAEIDLVAGGPPCQAFSVANTRTRGPQNGHTKLVWEFVRVVREIRPPAFILENVPGILGMGDGELVPSLISKFESIGYHVTVMHLNAADFGVPQLRRRIFLVGSTDGVVRVPRRTHGPSARRPYVTAGDALVGDLPSLDGGVGVETASYASPPRTGYQRWLRLRSRMLHDHVTTACGLKVKRRLEIIGQGQNLHRLAEAGKVPEDLQITIDHASVYRRLRLDTPSVTVVNYRKAMLIHPLENRLLSVREAARLQSFQDRFRFSGRLSFMQQLVGDSVPPLLSRAVARATAARINGHGEV
jgi:DNA (cytosine-5)-methyltransferase 1